MKLENQVTSLKLSKKLKELGVKQESYFWWIKRFKEWEVQPNTVGQEEYYSAFTVAELGERLPPQIFNKKDAKHYYYQQFGNNLGYWSSSGKSLGGMQNIVENEANARAKMLIYLIENNLLKK